MNALQGKTIISTRPLLDNDRIKELLVARGAHVIDLPMIQTECASLTEALKTQLSLFDQYNWIVFTSRNGVSCLADLLRRCGIQPEIQAAKKVAAIGKATAEEVYRQFGTVAQCSQGRNATDLLAEMLPQIQQTDKVLLALGELAEDTFSDGLADRCSVTRINVYRTLDIQYTAHPALDAVQQSNYDLILFTSPSGFRNFMKHTATLKPETLISAAIGTTTEAEMLKYGYTPQLVSPKSDADSFADAIERYLSTQHTT